MFGQTQTKTFSVDGMTCGHCEKRVEQAVGQTKSVTKVKASHVHRTVEVSFKKSNPPDEQALIEVITTLGYTVAGR